MPWRKCRTLCNLFDINKKGNKKTNNKKMEKLQKVEPRKQNLLIV